MREAIKNDLYFLVKFVLGYWWLCREPHKEFCEEIQKDKSSSLFLLPRGHCKTQIFNTGHTIQCYLKNPENPIGVFCDIQKRAGWKLRPLAYQFESNPTLKECFPDLLFQNPRKESKMWNKEEIILPAHDGRQEPSIGVYGLDNQPTSLHFPRIKGDDLVTPQTVTTADQIKKNIDAYGLMRSSILQSGGNIQICGTIYDDGDLHRVLEDSGQYSIYKRPAEYKKNGKIRYLWPVQYGKDKLDAIKNDPSVSVYIYSCNYLLDPAPEDENAYLQLKWMQRYRRLPSKLNYYAAADLAISEKDSACDTSIAVGGLGEGPDLYIAEVRKGHWDAIAIIENILDIQQKYGILLFAIEAENIARTIKPFLKLKMREKKIFGNFDYWMPQGDKIAKGRIFQGRAREGLIHIPDKSAGQPDWLFDTEYQMRKFPRAKEKDIFDSIALLCQTIDRHVSVSPEQKAEIHEPRDGYSDLYEDLDEWRTV
jgi:hypothetical protein